MRKVRETGGLETRGTKVRSIVGMHSVREEISLLLRERLFGYLILIHPPQIFIRHISTRDANLDVPSLTLLLFLPPSLSCHFMYNITV